MEQIREISVEEAIKYGIGIQGIASQYEMSNCEVIDFINASYPSHKALNYIKCLMANDKAQKKREDSIKREIENGKNLCRKKLENLENIKKVQKENEELQEKRENVREKIFELVRIIKGIDSQIIGNETKLKQLQDKIDSINEKLQQVRIKISNEGLIENEERLYIPDQWKNIYFQLIEDENVGEFKVNQLKGLAKVLALKKRFPEIQFIFEDPLMKDLFNR